MRLQTFRYVYSILFHHDIDFRGLGTIDPYQYYFVDLNMNENIFILLLLVYSGLVGTSSIIQTLIALF